MYSYRDVLIAQWAAMSLPEIVAVVLAVLYLLLVIRESIWCWLCAFASSAIYVWLFVEARLYMESLLYGFYAAMAIYGWHAWRHGGREHDELHVGSLPRATHARAILLLGTLALSAGFLLQAYTDAAWPYVDSLTTFLAVWATFLVARKVFENWYYWLAIDTVSIFVYWNRGLELTALLFVVYLLLIPVGMRQWWRSWQRQPETQP